MSLRQKETVPYEDINFQLNQDRMQNDLNYQKMILNQNEKFQSTKKFTNLAHKIPSQSQIPVQMPPKERVSFTPYYQQELKRVLLRFSRGQKLD